MVDGREIQIQMSNKSRGKTNQDHEQTVNVLAHKCQILLKITGIIISVSKAELIKASINIIEAPAKYDNLSLTEKKDEWNTKDQSPKNKSTFENPKRSQ